MMPLSKPKGGAARRPVVTWRVAAWTLFGLYAIVLLKLVLLKYPGPLNFLLKGSAMPPLRLRLQFSNFMPLHSILYYLSGDPSPGVAIENLAGNLLLFVPMGFLLPLLLPGFRRLWQAAFTALTVSLCLEVVQLLTGLGQFDVDDVILNTLGATAGWLLFAASAMALKRRRAKGLPG